MNYPYYPTQTYPSQTNAYPSQMGMGAAQPTQQIQNGGFVSAPNEEYARNYPIAHGKSVTFKDETAPYIYTKTMGFSQMDRPIFEKYRLTKEEDPIPEQIAVKDDRVEKLESAIAELREEINALKKAKNNTNNRPKNDGGN